MRAWVVTEEQYSQEGLEGAFLVFVGVAASPLAALSVIDDGRTYKRPHKFEINETGGTVTEYAEYDRGEWRNGSWVVTGKHWSEQTIYHIEEVELVE